ncbi:acyltransferase [Kordiimonas pumila]|uniref:Acyltransferase n=1 Tax=Kordiimonas pumila TaxID=2161677 RepID=A0ABV7D3J9_9PROT|nr:acyltransferase [Kordiimonas pumila]
MQNPFDPGYYDSSALSQMGFKAVGKNVMVAKNCTLINLHNISLGSHVRIDGGTTIVAGDAGVTIGHYIHIGGGSFLLGKHGITLGNFANISQAVRLYTTNDDYVGGAFTNPMVPERYTNVATGPVTVGKHTIIGSGSVVLPGVQLATGSSVGALSLIKNTTAEWTVYAGNPARAIKARKVVDSDGTVEARLLSDI